MEETMNDKKKAVAPSVSNELLDAAFARTYEWLNENSTWENDLDGLSGIDLGEAVLAQLKREIAGV